MQGANNYTGSTSVLFGSLIVAADAPFNAPGALGRATSNVIVGADSATFAVVGGGSAQLLIDGNFTIGRNVTLANGTFDKTLGAQNAPTGATFSGAVDLGTSTSVHLKATSATDKVTFSGGLSNGAAGGTVAIDGLGTISFAGAGKAYAYANATNISSGTLRIESGASFTGNGDVTVASGAQLIVHGSLSGSGALAINGGTVGGSGTINRPFTLDTGDVLSPGNGLGTLNTGVETWAGGGRLRLEIGSVTGGGGTGWDLVNVTGALSLTASSGSKFTLELDSLTSGGASGLLGNFNPNANYSWTFLTAGSVTGFNASAFTVDTSGFQNAFNGSFSVGLTGDGQGLTVNYLAVPEPSAALLALGGAALLFRRRRP
ncbi:MAG: hypothetical protein WDN28_09255 [Chthoniobacter sp.]